MLHFNATLLMMAEEEETAISNNAALTASAFTAAVNSSSNNHSAIATTTKYNNNDNTSITPKPRQNYNSTGHPLVTDQKSNSNTSTSTNDIITGNLNDSEKNTSYALNNFCVLCPDGSKVHLSANDKDDSINNNNTVSHIIIGRGKHGIPSSASHISRQACVLRLVDQS